VLLLGDVSGRLILRAPAVRSEHRFIAAGAAAAVATPTQSRALALARQASASRVQPASLCDPAAGAGADVLLKALTTPGGALASVPAENWHLVGHRPRPATLITTACPHAGGGGAATVLLVAAAR